VHAVESGSIKKGEKTVVVLRYLGPKGGPGASSPLPRFPSLSVLNGTRSYVNAGMPEMLKPTSLIMGAGLGKDVACLTDGRFSGGCVSSVLPPGHPVFLTAYAFAPYASSHGFVIGHVVPEAQVGGPIALVRDGDVISVDAINNTLELEISDEEMERRRKVWVAPPLKVTQGTLYKYAKAVEDASHGCVTDA
jgi:dihydroxy-acid dehydratase